MSCHDENGMFEPEMTVYHGSNCDYYAHDEFCCDGCKDSCTKGAPKCNICELQMKNLLAQLITLYPTTAFSFTMQDGTIITGTPTGMLDPYNNGIVVVTSSGDPTEYVNVCQIARVELLSATYNTQITYVSGCLCPTCSGCDESIRSLISVGEIICIPRGVPITGATVVAVAPGIIALDSGANLWFVSTCHMDSFTIIDNVTG